jgi:ABC-type lipoprotein release transport system permease subunit
VLVTAVLLIVTTLASNVPARRAVTVNRTVVLRAD